MYNFQRQLGTSLAEVMLASALGVFILWGFIPVYLTVKKNWILLQSIHAMEENGRFTTHFLSSYLRMAGFAACAGSSSFVNQEHALMGFDKNLPAFLRGKVLADTDSVQMGSCRIRNAKEEFRQTAFFVGLTTRKDALGRSIPALYETFTDGDKKELVADVENMQIRYGIAAPAGWNIASYVPASQVTDWLQVRLVSINLSFRSEWPVYTKPQPYFFSGKTMPPDRYLHKELTVDIALRERCAQCG